MAIEAKQTTQRTVVRPIRLDPYLDEVITKMAKEEERPVATMLYLLVKDGYQARIEKRTII